MDDDERELLDCFRRSTCEILIDKRSNDLPIKRFPGVHDVERKVEGFGHDVAA